VGVFRFSRHRLATRHDRQTGQWTLDRFEVHTQVQEYAIEVLVVMGRNGHTRGPWAGDRRGRGCWSGREELLVI